MIPLRDHNPSNSTPLVTYGLIAINVVVFVMMLGLSEVELERFVGEYALIPADIVRGVGLTTLITSMFLHGGFGHIIGNMLFLNIFGDNLEDRLGHAKYLFYYVLCGLAASGLQIFTDPRSMIPNLGASGAIAGLMGGYLVLFPRHKVDVLLPFGGFLSRSTLPAYTMLIYWFLVQFLQGFGSLGLDSEGGVAFFAHIGGFVAGVVGIILLKPFMKRV